MIPKPYSPNMTINAVDSKTANHPPPNIESRTIGSVSLTITFDSSRVTSTQYLPLFNKSSTRIAFFFSDSDPDCTMTWRFVSSRPIKPNVNPATECKRGSLDDCVYLLPAKKPPVRTRTNTMAIRPMYCSVVIAVVVVSTAWMAIKEGWALVGNENADPRNAIHNTRHMLRRAGAFWIYIDFMIKMKKKEKRVTKKETTALYTFCFKSTFSVVSIVTICMVLFASSLFHANADRMSPRDAHYGVLKKTCVLWCGFSSLVLYTWPFWIWLDEHNDLLDVPPFFTFRACLLSYP